MTLNLLAVGIVVLNIAVALGLYYLWNGRGGTADDGRYPLRSCDEHSGTWCRQ